MCHKDEILTCYNAEVKIFINKIPTCHCYKSAAKFVDFQLTKIVEYINCWLCGLGVSQPRLYSHTLCL